LRPGGGTLDVSGRLAGNRETWGWRMEVAATAANRSPLPLGALYGRERIADVESASVESAGNLDDVIESLGLRHRVVSRRTSLVAIAEEPSVDPRAPRRREKLAVEMPYGVSAEGVGLGVPLAMGGSLMLAEFDASVDLAAPAAAFLRGAPSTIRRKSELRGPDFHEIPALNIVWLDATNLVVEFASPHDGFVLPVDDIFLSGGFRVDLPLEVDRSKSSPSGPHASGVIVRLALRMKSARSWSTDYVSRVIWNSTSKRLFARQRVTGYAIALTTSPPPAESI
ncbi:MAG TPA: hypothetical protein VI198_02230, partial [Candidatus Eisenbacteria bacterium]